MDTDGGPRVVVGIDDSVGARAALRHALGEARRRGARLEVVAAFVSPERWAVTYKVPVVVDRETVRREVLAAARAVVDEVLAADAVEHPGATAPETTVRAEPGNAGEVLVGAARGAALLVLGHRGRGAAASTLLGSVGWWCLRHAPCPVSVVRPVGRPGHGREPARPSDVAAMR